MRFLDVVALRTAGMVGQPHIVSEAYSIVFPRQDIENSEKGAGLSIVEGSPHPLHCTQSMITLELKTGPHTR